MGVDFKNRYFCGKAVIDGFFQIQNADDEFYGFVGENAMYSLTRVIHPDDLYKFENSITELEAQEHNFVTLRMLRFDAEYRWMVIFLSYSKLEIINGQKLISFEMEDITIIMDELEVLKNTCEEYEEYFSLMEYFMLSYDIESDKFIIFMMANQQKINLYNGTLCDWKKNKISNEDLDNKDVPLFEKLCESFTNGDKTFEYEMKIKLFPEDDNMEWSLLKGKTIISSTGEKYVIATVSKINPVTKKHKINLTIESSKDNGTDLINKRAITKYATELINSKPNYPVTFAIIDLDNFKYVNDTYGHMFGDDVLSKVAEILKEAVDDKGVVGRIGGDEMLIILENIGSENELRGILRTIRSNVEWAYKGRLTSLMLSCSIGCASYPKDAKDYETLFNIADKCLYVAKEKGKNRYIIYDKELHGKYVEGIDDIIHFEKDFSKYNKINIVNDIMENLLYTKNMTIKQACEKVGPCFELEDISVFSGENRKSESYWGYLMDHDLDGEYFDKDNYISNFNDNNIMVIDNINYLVRKADSAYESMFISKINASIQYMVGPKEAPKGFITFNKSKSSKKWTELDISYLSILGKIFEMVLF
ncbi:GGDEF domain-containing protein [[Clostridium] fimetarium]|uniref:Diguanylate cyclase (GGDEF) domain-containing protein n=1 Tax=[Clostridium] fimetarium TaxID=99656 RepID=A0A1I0M1M5_9FIRM|nr:GGDEF domain-containing protein [[Clostridium] fimetarium]SEV82345.1 diguanylate cyclase (GGDEF) domain-containing protein [[Clostridium] fimetarium]